jgi:Bardet-Biedl syndrome 7 protein
VYSARLDGPVTAITRFTGGEKVTFGFSAAETDKKSAAVDLSTVSTTGGRPSAFDASAWKHFLYGTDNGLLGSLALDATGAKRGWTLTNDKKKGGIQVVSQIDLQNSGIPEMAVGRDDGSLEVYRMTPAAEPEMIWSRDLNESITAIDTGAVVGANSNEIVLSTYSGKVVVFSGEVTAPMGSMALAAPGPGSKVDPKAMEREAAENSKAISLLQKEIDALKDMVKREKDRYSKSATELVAVEQQFKIKDSFKLLPDQACYVLSVEIQMPIDIITLQSNVRIISLDVLTQNATVSISPPDAKVPAYAHMGVHHWFLRLM